ncbi:flagellar export protein FliJ [Desulfocurvibacter africanus subsp. africanus str. Walvis Bay]|uniref:Flagellar FliJ protein n=3 Tax=Desulfocurvibacter africanus TaxID=873 RepID=F3YX23_DESAF|nr:flagellar export protein FliJ [Desulfocurvibacter africanus subsp. africanus str. Walvis Bay]
MPCMPTQQHFKLEKVLDFRRQREEQAMLVMAEAQRRYRDQAEFLDGLKSRLARAEAEFFSRKAYTPPDLWLWNTYKKAADFDIKLADAALQRLAKELQRARLEVIARAKDRKLLEKLKENQAKRYEQEERLAEQKEFDESSTLRFKHQDF